MLFDCWGKQIGYGGKVKRYVSVCGGSKKYYHSKTILTLKVLNSENALSIWVGESLTVAVA